MKKYNEAITTGDVRTVSHFIKELEAGLALTEGQIASTARGMFRILKDALTEVEMPAELYIKDGAIYLDLGHGIDDVRLFVIQVDYLTCGPKCKIEKAYIRNAFEIPGTLNMDNIGGYILENLATE